MFIASLYMIGCAAVIYSEVSKSSYSMAGTCFVILMLLVGVFLQGRRAKKQGTEFFDWLVKNLDKIDKKTARYNGELITPDTELVSFSLTMSIFVLTTRESSGYMLKGGQATLTNALYTLGTFVFGWWGLPWGPVRALQSLVINLRGGEKKKVATLVEDIQAALHKENGQG